LDGRLIEECSIPFCKIGFSFRLTFHVLACL
jgi:hypothetical protein